MLGTAQHVPISLLVLACVINARRAVVGTEGDGVDETVRLSLLGFALELRVGRDLASVPTGDAQESVRGRV